MLEYWFCSLGIGLSQTGIALLQSDGWRRSHSTLLAEHSLHATTPDRLGLQLRTALADVRCAGLPARIVLADHWTRLFMVTPPRNSTRLADCQAAAAMRFQVLYGAPPNDWRIEADWDTRHPFLACAIPRMLCDTLQQASTEQGLKLISVQPHFIATWNRWRKKLKADAWLGVAYEDSLAIGMMVQRQLSAVRIITMIPDSWHDADWLPEQLGREALRLNLFPPGRIQLCGAVPSHWTAQTTGALICERLAGPENTTDCAPGSSATALAHAAVRP